jgi:hypothetical protein
MKLRRARLQEASEQEQRLIWISSVRDIGEQIMIPTGGRHGGDSGAREQTPRQIEIIEPGAGELPD